MLTVIKHVIAIIVLSIIIILGMSYAQQGLQLITSAHTFVSDALKQVFSVGEAGNLIRQLLALLAVPVAVGMVPMLIYWLAKRTWFPFFMEIVWIIWLIQVSALIILYKVA